MVFCGHISLKTLSYSFKPAVSTGGFVFSKIVSILAERTRHDNEKNLPNHKANKQGQRQKGRPFFYFLKLKTCLIKKHLQTLQI
jgi:hypothetical protein